MTVGKYFRGNFGGDQVEDHLSEIAAIFDGYDSHHNEFRIQSELDTKFSEYNGLDLYQRTFLRAAVGHAVREMIAPEGAIRDDDCSDRDACRDALRLILKAASSHPELMQGISTELSKTAGDMRYDSVICNKNSLNEIFGFKELSQYPLLSPGLSEYISAILDHRDDIAMEFFADIVGQFEGTPYLSIVQESHIEAYLTASVYSIGSGEGTVAKDFWKMKAIPSLWQKIEAFSGDVFFAHAPELDIVGFNYFMDYNRDHSCMTIEFNRATELGVANSIDATWVDNLFDDTDLEKAYILVNHALGVLNGTRDGATTLNKAWIEHQRKHLIPMMEAALHKMVAEFGDRGLAIPDMPDIKPIAGQGHLAGFSLAGYNAFRLHP